VELSNGLRASGVRHTNNYDGRGCVGDNDFLRLDDEDVVFNAPVIAGKSFYGASAATEGLGRTENKLGRHNYVDKAVLGDQTLSCENKSVFGVGARSDGVDYDNRPARDCT